MTPRYVRVEGIEELLTDSVDVIPSIPRIQ